jgi:demethylmacrocin O-methyltransferase
MLENNYNAMKSPWLLPIYDEVFKRLKDEPIRLLELGILGGGSLQMWRDYFQKGIIIGFDREPFMADYGDRVFFKQGDQGDPGAFRWIKDEWPFDIIIDDCAHQGALARASFNILFPHLKPGGIYVVEDWGTGYWGSAWPDGTPYESGKIHTGGMVGFIHELVDETGADDIRELARPSKFEWMRLSWGQCIIKKANRNAI